MRPGSCLKPAWPGGRVRGRPLEVLTSGMPVDGEYEPSPQGWVREQVELYESSGGTQGTTLRDSGLPVVIITNRGVRSGKLRKTPLMRVEHDGRYAAVASQGGAPAHPRWYYNFCADPRVELRDGPRKQDMIAREVTGDERAAWWERAVAAFPPYAEYQRKTERQIPVFVLSPAGES
jgi:F420H(2)-dependent quinone reductase